MTNKETHRHGQKFSGYQRERGGGKVIRVKKVKYMMMDRNLTLGGEHTMQYTDDAL